jgi:hypothetical protein
MDLSRLRVKLQRDFGRGQLWLVGTTGLKRREELLGFSSFKSRQPKYSRSGSDRDRVEPRPFSDFADFTPI